MSGYDSERLRTLVAVVEHGTFDAAARALHVTAPAISQRMKALESQAGRILLRRTVPVQATTAGEALLRLGRQLIALEEEAASTLQESTGQSPSIQVAVNADSLATWFLDAFGRIAAELDVMVELHRDDEYHSTSLLRSGTVMAAVTANPEPLQGCRTHPLGVLRYLPVASPAWLERWMPDGIDLQRLQGAPLIDFDPKDQHQDRFVRQRLRQALSAPRHWIPSSEGYHQAVRRGIGWGLVPEVQCGPDIASGHLVELTPGQPYDVTLHWQRWRIDTAALAGAGRIVREEAARALRPVV